MKPDETNMLRAFFATMDYLAALKRLSKEEFLLLIRALEETQEAMK